MNTRYLLVLWLVVAGGTATYAVLESSVVSYKLELQPSDLEEPPTVNSTYPNITLIQCAAIASRTPNITFCYTNFRECISTNASLPPYYNHSSGQPFHRCFTNTQPLFNKAEAVLNCTIRGDCCPLPFRNIQNVGCVYTPVFWWFPNLPFFIARRLCQSVYPSGDLYSKPTDWNALKNFINSENQNFLWIGATRIESTSSFKWLDGTAVDAGKFGTYTRDSTGTWLWIQPDGRGYVGETGDADCVQVFTGEKETDSALADEFCYTWSPYICVIP